MAYINSVIIQGNLVRKPELHQLPSGTCVGSFTVAVNRSYPKRDGSWQNDVSYFDCETWANEAQRCEEELEKGCHVKVVGRLRQDRWQDKEGRSHSKIKIVSEYFERQQTQRQSHRVESLHAEAIQAVASTPSNLAASSSQSGSDI